ncbi:hypothetical protein RSAG8_08881, partial [Rhizoctonia solani AG-8 WAC10335]
SMYPFNRTPCLSRLNLLTSPQQVRRCRDRSIADLTS